MSKENTEKVFVDTTNEDARLENLGYEQGKNIVVGIACHTYKIPFRAQTFF